MPPFIISNKELLKLFKNDSIKNYKWFLHLRYFNRNVKVNGAKKTFLFYRGKNTKILYKLKFALNKLNF